MSLQITESRPFDIVLTLRSSHDVALERLLDIALLYVNEHDELADKIHDWCKVMQDLDLAGESEDNARGIMSELVVKLMTTVLVDPVIKTPYRNPVWINGWVLEKSWVSYLDSFDGKPILTREPHEFAQAVINWVVALFGHDQALSVVRAEPNCLATKFILNMIAEKFVQCRALERQTAEDERKITLYDDKLKDLKKFNHDQVALADKAFKEHEIKIKEQIASLENKHDQNNADLKKQIKEEREINDKTHAMQQGLLKALETDLENKRTQLGNLKEELKASHQVTDAQQQEILALQNRISNLEGSVNSLRKKKKAFIRIG